MSVFEEGRVFEAETQEAIYCDVGDPDEGDGRGRVPVQEIASEEKGDGEPEGVDEVVGCCACAWIHQKAEHEEIGSEEEYGEEDPAVVEMLVEEDGE